MSVCVCVCVCVCGYRIEGCMRAGNRGEQVGSQRGGCEMF